MQTSSTALYEFHRSCRKGDLGTLTKTLRPELVNAQDERVTTSQLGLTALAHAVMNAQLEAAIEAAWDARDTITPASTGEQRDAKTFGDLNSCE